MDGEKLNLCTEPLEHYFHLSGTRPHFAPGRTSCWRSYVGTWEIREGRLYLIEISADYRDGRPVKLEDIFPGHPERVFAHWFTGVLRCPRGSMLAYEHMGYGSIFEEDILLHVKHGVLVSREVRANEPENDTDDMGACLELGEKAEKHSFSKVLSAVKGNVFYPITVAVAVVGLGLGREGSPIDPPFSLLFAIPGAFALVFSLLMTVIAVWGYAPVLIERAPAAVRPLFAPIIIAIWASIPLLIFHLSHGLSFNFGAVINYFWFRGVAVAEVFFVAIVAFLFGYGYPLRGSKRIQPYVLIPVIAMFIAFWLSPDSDDPALEITGLSAGVVYYGGVLVAALLGFFLGEVARRNRGQMSL